MVEQNLGQVVVLILCSARYRAILLTSTWHQSDGRTESWPVCSSDPLLCAVQSYSSYLHLTPVWW
jgi:hypothetical protein